MNNGIVCTTYTQSLVNLVKSAITRTIHPNIKPVYRQHWPYFISFLVVCLSCTLIQNNAVAQTNEIIKLLAPDGDYRDEFGYSVAIEHQVATIGAWRHSGGNGFQTGSAYVFDVNTGALLFTLIDSMGAQHYDRFGRTVAMNNGFIVIGKEAGDLSDSDKNGNANLFQTSNGFYLFDLAPADPYKEDEHGGYGASVAIHKNTIAIGAYGDPDENVLGSIFLFDTSSNVPINRIFPDDNVDGSLFGCDITLNDNYIVVGAPRDNTSGTDAGAAYIFDRTTGLQIAKLLPPPTRNGGFFGNAVAISNSNIIAVGYPQDSSITGWQGSVYLYDAATGSKLAVLTANDGDFSDEFGFDVAIDHNLLVVGARFDEPNGTNSGSAYVFDLDTFQQVAKLVPSDGEPGDWFGQSVAVDAYGTNAYIVVGSFQDDTNGNNNSGSAYVFSVPVPCAADLDDDGDVDTHDFTLFLNAWSAGDPLADWNGDGQINTADFSSYLNSWTVGCP